MAGLSEIVNRKRELLMRDTFSRPVLNRSEGMSADEKDRYIDYLADRVTNLDLDKRAMELVLEDFLKSQQQLQETVAALQAGQEKLQSQLDEEIRKRKAAERKAQRLDERLKYANSSRFGDRRQKVKKESDKAEEPDRNKEKEDFDGTGGTLCTDSVVLEKEVQVDQPVKKERDLSNRPEKYSTMRVQGEPQRHHSDLAKVPGRILDKKMVKVFRLDMCLVEEHFEMVQYVEPGKKPRWGYFPQQGHPQVVTKFEGTKATPEFLQAIAYEVYVKNVTFGLLHQWLTDMGMTISANTLRNWLKKGKKYLDQLIVVLKSIALEKDSIVNCDETWCKVRKYDHYKKCYIWVLVNKAEKICIFFYEDGSRGRDVLANFLGDAELRSVMTDGYNAYVFIGNELKSTQYKDTIHQVCLSHCNNKFVKAANQGGEPKAALFSADFGELYSREHRYDEAGLDSEERLKERQSLETKEIAIRIRSRLDAELANESEFRSPYYTEALNYLNHFWNELFAYLDDGDLPIDNNLAERCIRKLTTQRNSMLHFGSDEGVEMAATYHSIISTVKLHGRSAWHFLGAFFTKIFNGCRDFFSLTPENIEWQYANS